MMAVLILAGLSLAVSLSFIFLRIAAAKTKSDIKNQQKSNFLARMSHEIRTPMNAILGIAEIQLQNETLPQDISEAFIKINNSGDLLICIINDILDLSKIEAGKLELASAKYDVPSLINDTVQLNILYFESKPIEFKLFVDEHVPLSLIGDELRIKQILNNLLSNAFKYTERGEVVLTVTADYMPQGGTIHVPLVFRVSDTGQGMTAEQIRNLGDEYSRFNMEANRTTAGTGLGISITKHLVRMMNGEISVESEPGKGSVFTVRLPQQIVGEKTLGREVAENLMQFRIGRAGQIKKMPQIVREYMPYGRVLIVDDVESNLYVAKGLIAPYGLSVETSVSGFEAVEKIKGGAVFDIIFMDHFMPKMDGIEAAKILRDLGYTRPIIALTANALAGQADIFLNNGFDGFISKPIDIRQLNASLNKYIRGRYPPEVVAAARRQMEKLAKPPAEKVQPAAGQELAAIFSRDAEKALERLDAIYSNAYRRTDDIRMFVINVHAMKSALANIGETGLSADALKLEQAGRAEDIKTMMAKTPAFLEARRKVIEKNKPKENDSEAAQEDLDNMRAYLGEKLLAVQKACEEYDETTANTALAELGQKKWPHSTRKLLDTIAEHLLHSDFEDAARLAKDLCEKS
jgi:CheY-like chemotaxis protein/nitrogen-specific signal transduction histidine kinase